MRKEDFPHSSAARNMVTEVPTAGKEETVGSVLNRIKSRIRKFKTIDYVYVIDKAEALVGVVSIKELFASSKASKVGGIMSKGIISVHPEEDCEKVADLAVKHNIKAVPVVKKGKFLGVVPTDNILSILNRALRIDILHLAGIHKAHLKYENTLAVPLFLSILHRVPWLVIGLLGVTLAAMFISTFEVTLQKYLLLAFFTPAIVYMSDALGTQHQTLFVRDLAVMGNELKLGKYIARQMIIGALLSLIIGVLMFLIIALFWKQQFVGFVISISMVITLIISSFTALMVTLLIKRLNFDPALGSGPLATIVSDVTSIILYFFIAFLFLGV